METAAFCMTTLLDGIIAARSHGRDRTDSTVPCPSTTHALLKVPCSKARDSNTIFSRRAALGWPQLLGREAVKFRL